MSAADPLPPTDALQKQPPEPPLAKIHYPDAMPAAPDVALPPTSTVWTKLYLLLHAHQLAASAARRMLVWRIVLLAAGLTVAIPLGIAAGIGVGTLVYQDPERHAQKYNMGGGAYTYYIRGRQVSQQEYDYYLRTNGNESVAVAAAIPSGIVVGLLTLVVLLLLLRPRKPTVLLSVEEQIVAITKEHPEAVASWGGPGVLRVPQLIERLLDMQSRDARR
jgi:hypothetical protein